MSAELKDLRGKITAETDCVLEAINRATGMDKSVIVREVLHEWAINKIREHSILMKLLAAEGVSGIDEGIAGNSRE